jgi:hypothetical protein
MADRKLPCGVIGASVDIHLQGVPSKLQSVSVLARRSIASVRKRMPRLANLRSRMTQATPIGVDCGKREKSVPVTVAAICP